VASPVGVSAFVADDVLKFVLPAFLGYALLVPFWNPRISAELLLMSAIFTGFVATPLVGNTYLAIIKLFSNSVREIWDLHERWSRRWHYDRMFHGISRDERNAITLSDARATFTLMLSANFSLFAIAVLIDSLARAGWPEADQLPDWMRELAMTGVPILTNVRLPSIVCLPVAVIIASRSLTYYLNLQRSLFGDQYPEIARKQQRDHGEIATAIWGRVIDNRDAARDADATGSSSEAPDSRQLHLVNMHGAEIAVSGLDADGQFTFPVNPQSYLSQRLRVTLLEGDRTYFDTQTITEKSVPEFEINVTA